jgi:hypothetical protein
VAEGYSDTATERCERVLGTLMRGIGQPWRHRVYLVGGLVPRYLVQGDGCDQYIGYAALRASGGTDAETARARNEAVLVVRQFAEALQALGFGEETE